MAGLKKSDIHLLYNGRRKPISFFLAYRSNARFHVEIHDTDWAYTKQRSIDTMTPNKLAVYFVADMVCGRYRRTPNRRLMHNIARQKDAYSSLISKENRAQCVLLFIVRLYFYRDRRGDRLRLLMHLLFSPDGSTIYFMQYIFTRAQLVSCGAALH